MHIVFLLCWCTFLVHEEANRPQRSWIKERADEYRSFVTGLKALPPPTHGVVIYFDSQPSNFYPVCLLATNQVALVRTDVDARLVSEFQPKPRIGFGSKGRV
jgi:hypothetical protein